MFVELHSNLQHYKIKSQVCSIVLLPPTTFHIWISAAELLTSVSLSVLWISKRLANKHKSKCQVILLKHTPDQLPSLILEVNPDSSSMQTIRISIQNKNTPQARRDKETLP